MFSVHNLFLLPPVAQKVSYCRFIIIRLIYFLVAMVNLLPNSCLFTDSAHTYQFSIHLKYGLGHQIQAHSSLGLVTTNSALLQ